MPEFEPKRDKSLCEHGNFPKSCSQCRAITILGVEREDLSESVQQMRAKKNVRYVKEGVGMIAKYVYAQPGDRRNINRVARERRLLEKLADTGAVPRVLDFKEYHDDKSRLLLEQLPGTSIDRIPWRERGSFTQRYAEDLVRVTAESLHAIHERGVLVVDVNEGTFLLEEKDNTLSAKLVDFEFGYDLDHPDEVDLQDSFSFLRKNDFGFALAEYEGRDLPEDALLLAKCEMHRWAKTMERIFINRYVKVEIPPEQAEASADYQARMLPAVEKVLGEHAKRWYAQMQETQRDSERKFLDMGEEGYIAWSVKLGTGTTLIQQCAKFTFAPLCKINGAPLSEKSLEFISKCLSMDIEERPSSFDEFLRDD